MDLGAAFTLPSSPRVVALLRSELLAERPSLRRVNQLFAVDPALAARLLALANAPAQLLSGQVSSTAQALTLLSLHDWRRLAEQAQLGAGGRLARQLDWALFWRCSQSAARLSAALAAQVGADTGTAYSAALVHGLGQILLQQTQPDTMQELDQQLRLWDPRRPRLEFQRLGYCASAISAALAKQWHWPAALVDGLRCMEAPLSHAELEPLAGVLHLAAWAVRAKACGWTHKQLVMSFPDDLALALGLDMDGVLQQDAIDWNPSTTYLV